MVVTRSPTPLFASQGWLCAHSLVPGLPRKSVQKPLSLAVSAPKTQRELGREVPVHHVDQGRGQAKVGHKAPWQRRQQLQDTNGVQEGKQACMSMQPLAYS